MAIPRGVTPTFTLKFNEEDLDLTQVQSVYVTFSYGKGKITKDIESLDVRENEIDVFLSQSETLSFPVGIVEIQVNWVYNNGVRGASDCVSYRFSKQLLDKVVS